MRDSTRLQNEIVEKLSYLNAEKEWPIKKNATDRFSNQKQVYLPRLDVAVGPFSIVEGNTHDAIMKIFKQIAPKKLQEYVKENKLKENPNPRCMLAIEIAYSGSSKHMLGDMTNASMMGLYGFVIGSRSTIDKLNRIFHYSKILKDLGKMEKNLFTNVCIISKEKFMELLNN